MPKLRVNKKLQKVHDALVAADNLARAMPLHSEVLVRSYGVDIPMDAMERLMDRESIKKRDYTRFSLAQELDHVDGVSNTNYDGHFGAVIFFDVDDENDTPYLHQQVHDIIRRHVKE